MSQSVLYTRAKLSVFLKKSKAEGISLLSILEAYRDSSVCDEEQSGGFVLIGTSSKGDSVQFRQSEHGNPTESRVEFGQLLVDAVNNAVAELGGTPTDDEIFAAIMAKLTSARRVRTDFSYLCR